MKAALVFDVEYRYVMGGQEGRRFFIGALVMIRKTLTLKPDSLMAASVFAMRSVMMGATTMTVASREDSGIGS